MSLSRFCSSCYPVNINFETDASLTYALVLVRARIRALRFGYRLYIVNFLIGILLFLIAPSPQAEVLSDYRLGSGDVVKIAVYEEPDLGLEVKLNDAGTVSYPFLGQVEVAGLTVGQLEDRITDGLKGDYLIDPNVTVSVKEYRPFYIHGEVEDPGGFPFSPGLTLRKAVALAGGYTERASKSKIFVIRDGAPRVSEKGRQISIDEELMPGDIVTIEQSFF